METKPTHEQAQLHLQVYDLRREARLRQARDSRTTSWTLSRTPCASRHPERNPEHSREW
jgi:hypothetical protein